MRTKEQTIRDEQIYQLTTLVAGEFSLQEVLDKLSEAAVKITGVKACSIRLLNEEDGDLKMRSTYGLSEAYRNKGVVSKDDPVIKAAFEGKAIVIDDMRVDNRIKYPAETMREGLVSQLTVAMQFRNRGIGVIRLYSPQPKHFGKEDIGLARAVASQCAVAITNAKLYYEALQGARMAEQMRLAGAIQRRMIPNEPPQITGLDIAATYVPCFDVGGDLYNFYSVNDHCLAINIADVIGKGVPAALMMSSFRGAIRAYLDNLSGQFNGQMDPARFEQLMAQVIQNLNKMACSECRDGEFITLFHCAIDMKGKRLMYCNCGHEPAIMIRGEKIIELEKGGLVLGVESNTDYETGSVELEKGDCLIFYTDGLIDAMNFDGDTWGRQQMLEAAVKHVSMTSEQILRNILRYRRRFVGLAQQVDDTSIIVVKYDDSLSIAKA